MEAAEINNFVFNYSATAIDTNKDTDRKLYFIKITTNRCSKWGSFKYPSEMSIMGRVVVEDVENFIKLALIHGFNTKNRSFQMVFSFNSVFFLLQINKDFDTAIRDYNFLCYILKYIEM